jgi:hypothetical protein
MERFDVKDLANYEEVLAMVTKDEEVELWRGGEMEYVLVDAREYKRMKATLWLLEETREARAQLARGEGIPLEEFRKEFGLE